MYLRTWAIGLLLTCYLYIVIRITYCPCIKDCKWMVELIKKIMLSCVPFLLHETKQIEKLQIYININKYYDYTLFAFLILQYCQFTQSHYFYTNLVSFNCIKNTFLYIKYIFIITHLQYRNTKLKVLSFLKIVNKQSHFPYLVVDFYNLESPSFNLSVYEKTQWPIRFLSQYITMVKWNEHIWFVAYFNLFHCNLAQFALQFIVIFWGRSTDTSVM